jgi:CRP/FNR family cyclic AMP-dependent transcriptional regulator
VTAVPELAERAATLIEADPSLGSLLTMREIAAIGHRAILPVLTLRVGAWTPPARAELGAATAALIILEGVLTDATQVLGPGDAIEPWDTGDWTACTPVRLAIIGDAYAVALRSWPTVTARLRVRSNCGTAVPAAGGSMPERLLELLWRVALRYGTLSTAGVALPQALDIRALGLILGVAELELVLALAELQERAAFDHEQPVWVLRTRPPAGAVTVDDRREHLLMRVAGALAVARAGRMNTFAVSEQLQLELRHGATLSSRRRGGSAR